MGAEVGENPRICMGCFSEWETEEKVCPYCGWNSDGNEPKLKRWNVGEVIENRYLIGRVLCTVEDIAIWRMYDRVLGQPVFVIRHLEGSPVALYDFAMRFWKMEKMEPEYIKPLCIKQFGKVHVLIFSLQEKHVDLQKLRSLWTKEQTEEQTLVGNIEGKKEGWEEKVLESGTVLANAYRIIGCIGIGGFGVTYLCEDLNLHRNVAIKEYFPDEWAEREEKFVNVKKSGMLQAFSYGKKMFEREIQITAQFIHTPHLVTVFDAFEENDTMYMVMEFIQGQSIAKEFKSREFKPYSIDEMKEIILPVLDGLAQIHDRSIVHSDISPGNIIRKENGDVCLIDMGAAKYALNNQPVLNAAFLKIDYAAPEQYRTAREGIPDGEGAWTDVYAVGATMYYLLTGSKPMDVISRLEAKKPELVLPKKCRAKVPKKWLKLINQAMLLDREKRIQTAGELKQRMLEL